MYRALLRRSMVNSPLNNFRDVLIANNGLIVKNAQGEILLDLSGGGGGTSSISIDDIDTSNPGDTMNIAETNAAITNIGSNINTINMKAISNINTTTTTNTNIGNLTGSVTIIGAINTLTGPINMNTAGNKATSIGNGSSVLSLTGSDVSFTTQLTIPQTSNQVLLGTTNTTTLNAENAGGAKTYTIPNTGGNTDFILSTGAQTISGTKTLSAITTISNATQSTSTGDGALVVSGGVGIGGNLSTGGVLNYNGKQIISETRDNILTTLNTAGISFLDNTLSFTGTLASGSSGQIKKIKLLHQKGQNVKITCSPHGSLFFNDENQYKELVYINGEWRLNNLNTSKFFVTTQQSTRLTGTGATGNANQGRSVSLSADGSTMASGGPLDDSSVGATWVFTRSGASWSQQGSKLVGTGASGSSGQGIGVSLSADGNTLVIGGSSDGSGIGATWVFTRSGSVWSQQGSKLVGGSNVGNSAQGSSVAISADGNTLVIGGNGDDSGKGAIWIFTRSGGTWSQQGGKLVGSEIETGDGMGKSVSINVDGNEFVVLGDGGNGKVWSFKRKSGVWTEQGARIHGTGSFPLVKSLSLSADGNRLGIVSTDAFLLYEKDGSSWIKTEKEFLSSNINAIGLNSDGETIIVGNNTNVAEIYNSRILMNNVGGAGNTDDIESVYINESGNTAVIGAPNNNSSEGAAWISV